MMKFLFVVLVAITLGFIKTEKMDVKENVNVSEVYDETCYTIGNYMLCPEKKVINVGRMFGTATRDAFGYFADSTLQYDKETMIIFGGVAFIDKSNLNIDWEKAQLLSFRDNYVQFTDGKSLYQISGSTTQKTSEYDKNTYTPYAEQTPQKRTDRIELGEKFYVEGDTFFYDKTPVLEPFDIPSMRIVTSKNGYETNFATDGKQVIFCGPTGFRTTRENGKEYTVVKHLIIKGVDLDSLRVLGKNLLVDKNALYYCTNIIPFDKLNGFKFIIREL